MTVHNPGGSQNYANVQANGSAPKGMGHGDAGRFMVQNKAPQPCEKETP
jgi:hypothetical protein